MESHRALKQFTYCRERYCLAGVTKLLLKSVLCGHKSARNAVVIPCRRASRKRIVRTCNMRSPLCGERLRIWLRYCCCEDFVDADNLFEPVLARVLLCVRKYQARQIGDVDGKEKRTCKGQKGGDEPKEARRKKGGSQESHSKKNQRCQKASSQKGTEKVA